MSALQFHQVSVDLGQNSILNAIDLELNSGELVGLVGPNGAGKTSLMRAGLGLIPINQGQVLLNGRSIEQFNPKARAREIAYLPQDKTIAWNMTGRDMVALGLYARAGAKPYGQLGPEYRSRIKTVLERVGATDFAKRSVHSLSGGEQARLHLARLLVARAEIMLVDEPCAALDPLWQVKTLSLLKAEARRGASVLVALHDLQLAERFADRIIVLDRGQIMVDQAGHKGLSQAVLAQVFGVKRRTVGGFDPA